LTNAKQELEKYESMTIEQAEKQIQQERAHSVEETRKALSKYKRINKAYAKVKAEIEQWTPPTKEHNGLKDFALSQINMCIETDIIKYYERKLEEELPTAAQWLADRVKMAQEDIEHCTKKIQEEQKRVAQSNQWLKQFRESLQ